MPVLILEPAPTGTVWRVNRHRQRECPRRSWCRLVPVGAGWKSRTGTGRRAGFKAKTGANNQNVPVVPVEIEKPLEKVDKAWVRERGAALSGRRVVVDTGCGNEPSCLACHLPLCWHDMTREQGRSWLRGRSAGDAPVAPAANGRGEWTVRGDDTRTVRPAGWQKQPGPEEYSRWPERFLGCGST